MPESFDKASAWHKKVYRARDNSEGMGCTQREPFVLYGHIRGPVIVNRCEGIPKSGPFEE